MDKKEDKSYSGRQPQRKKVLWFQNVINNLKKLHSKPVAAPAQSVFQQLNMGMLFLGATLWTDFELFDPEKNAGYVRVGAAHEGLSPDQGLASAV